MADDDALTDEDDDDGMPLVKQMVRPRIPRVDAVKGPASALKFVVLKADGPQDPAAIARVQKAEISTADQNDKPDSDFAYIEAGGKKDEGGDTVPRSLRHFYIGDADHVRNALARASQSPFGDKAMPKIKAAAKKFGIDVSKSKEAQMGDQSTETAADEPKLVSDGRPRKATRERVRKAEVPEGDEPLPDADDLNEEATPDAEGEPVPTEASGDPDDPETPAWEAVDAARGRQAVDLVVALKRLIAVAADREAQEAAVGADHDDAENVWDLEDVDQALDFVLGTLAPFAVSEQAESDDREADLTEVTKAGRVLSSANEDKVRQAVTMLQGVLSTLPAPTEESDVEEPVTKAKADDGVVAVYNSAGQLVGTVPEAQLTPLKDAPAPEGTAAPAPDEPDDDDAADDTAGDQQDAAATAPAAPAAPAAPVAAPAAPVAKSQDLPEPVLSVIKQLQGMDGRTQELAEQIIDIQSKIASTSDPAARAAMRRDEEAVRKELREIANPELRSDLQKRLAYEMLVGGYDAQRDFGAPTPVTKSQEAAPAGLAEIITAAVTQGVEAAREDDRRVIKQLQDRVDEVGRMAQPGGPMLNTAAIFGRDAGGIDVPPEVEAVRKQLDAARDPLEQNRLKRLLALELLKQGIPSR